MTARIGFSILQEAIPTSWLDWFREKVALRVPYDADYEPAPNMNLVAGNYAGLRADNQTVNVTVDSAGTLSGHSTDGCTFAGTLSPRAKGNVFHHAVTFGSGVCRQETEAINGVAFV